MDVKKLIVGVILSYVGLQVAGILYPLLSALITNLTGYGYTGIAVLTIITSLYWLLIAFAIVMYLLSSLGMNLGKKYH